MASCKFVAMSVRQDKEEHPERFCSVPRCLWRTSKLNHETQQHELNVKTCGKHPQYAPEKTPALPVGEAI